MKEFKAVILELKNLTYDENEEVISGELDLKSKEFKNGFYDEDNSSINFTDTTKITKCLKNVGNFKRNQEGLYELTFNEKGLFDTNFIEKFMNDTNLIYSKSSIHNLIKQLIAIEEIEKKMKKYQKKGWHTFYLGRAEKENGDEVILHFACKDHSTTTSKKAYYESKLAEHKLTHKTLETVSEIKQLEKYKTIKYFLQNSQI